MALGRFRFLPRWSDLRSAFSAEDRNALEQRDRQIEDYLSSVGIDIDALRALSAGYVKATGSGGYTSATISDVLTDLKTVDGAGSGLDADLLDGNSSAYFLAASSYTAADVLSKLLTVDGAGSGLDADLLDGNSSAHFLAASAYTAADVLSKLLTVDGAGSGVDADLLDGQSSAYYQNAGNLNAGTLANARFPTTWSSYSPTFGGITIGNGTIVGAYLQVGIMVDWYAFLQQGSTTSRSGTNLSVTLPVTAATIATQQELVGTCQVFYVDNSVSSTTFWQGTGKYGTTSVELQDLSNNAQGTDDTNTMAANGTDPFGAAWGTNDKIMIRGRYTAAST